VTMHPAIRRLCLALGAVGTAAALTVGAPAQEAGDAAGERDPQELRAAAEDGAAEAQLALGTRLLESDRESDWAEGVAWLEKAARQGMPVYLLIADAYHEGIGVARDLEEAAHWYRIGAEVGDGLAQLALGQMYMDGGGLERDLVQAAVYLQLAVERIDDAEAKQRAEKALTRAKLRTSGKDWKRARRRAEKWQPKPVSELIN